jgi:hypothetical protein
MKRVFTSLCAGVVIVMPRFLAALVKEEKSRSPQPLRAYFAKFNPSSVVEN